MEDFSCAYCSIEAWLLHTQGSLDGVKESGQKENYMTVPAALKELEKIEMIKSSDNTYRNNTEILE